MEKTKEGAVRYVRNGSTPQADITDIAPGAVETYCRAIPLNQQKQEGIMQLLENKY